MLRTYRRNRRLIIGLFLIPVFVFFFIAWGLEHPTHPLPEWPQSSKTKARVKIVVYKDDASKDIDSVASSHIRPAEKSDCSGSVKYCSISTDKDDFANADAVVFEARPKDPLHVWDWLRDPVTLPQKRPGQAWINYGFNNPTSYPLLNQLGYTSLFDLNMTLNQKSQIPVSLHCFWGGGNMKTVLDTQPPPKSASKAVFFSNNCGIGGARNRTLYVKELMTFMDIDSYGTCLNNKELSSSIRDGLLKSPETSSHKTAIKSLIELFSKYKFVLAFESTNLTDFVTEKLMLAFESGSLPVYMGAPNVDDWIPHRESIVRVDKFESPEDLADHLNKLDSDHSDYSRYFAWKKNNKLSRSFLNKLTNCIHDPDLACRMCEAVSRKLIGMKPNYIGETDHVILDKSHALDFDGSSSYVEIPDSAQIRLSEVFTISSWVYLKGIPYDFRIVDKNTAGKVDGFEFDILQKDERAFVRLCAGNGCWNGMKPIFPETWYHVAVVFMSTTTAEQIKRESGKEEMAGIFFYVNGVLDYKIEHPVPMFGLKEARKNSLPLRIGRAGSGNSFWKGIIDDVSIWERSLSQDEIRKVMFTRLGGKEEGLVAYYSFDEGEGSVAYDYTGNHHGTVYNAKYIASEQKELVLNDCV